ncbi:MAG TPA: glycosyltransferase 87 family protein [Thermoanaerobaculia bacterium]
MARHPRAFSARGATPWILVAAAEAAYLGLAALPDARAKLPAYLALAAAAGIVSLLAATILSGSRPAFLILAAVVFRATLLTRPPDLSDDQQRYLWDARVCAAGISPFAHAPEDPAVARLAPEASARLPHRDLPTIYPPVAQTAFLVGSGGGRHPIALKALFAAADVAIVWLLARLGAGFGAALYAFHPLPVLETAGQGHLDSLGVALLLTSLVLLAGRRAVLSGLAFALSVLTKYVPAGAILPVLRRGGARWAVAAAFAATAVWAAWSRGGVSPAGSLGAYATRWEFNSVLYRGALSLVRATDLPARAKAEFLEWKARHGHPAWTARIFPYFYDGFFARALLGVLLAALLVGIAARVADARMAVFASLAALLLFSPTLHPWYLLWVLPFAAWKREPAFLYLSFAVPLAYGILYPIPGVAPGALLAAEYVPFGILLAFTLCRTAAA